MSSQNHIKLWRKAKIHLLDLKTFNIRNAMSQNAVALKDNTLLWMKQAEKKEIPVYFLPLCKVYIMLQFYGNRTKNTVKIPDYLQ